MNLMNFFIRRSSAPVARERLQILLAHERVLVSGEPDLVGVLREQILELVAKHVSVDQDRVRVQMNRDAAVSTLEIELELPAPAPASRAAASARFGQPARETPRAVGMRCHEPCAASGSPVAAAPTGSGRGAKLRDAFGCDRTADAPEAIARRSACTLSRSASSQGGLSATPSRSAVRATSTLAEISIAVRAGTEATSCSIDWSSRRSSSRRPRCSSASMRGDPSMPRNAAQRRPRALIEGVPSRPD
jgi:cell division topological specificity factor